MITVKSEGDWLDKYFNCYEVEQHIIKAVCLAGMHNPEVTEISDVRVVLQVKNRMMGCTYTDIFEGPKEEIIWVTDFLARIKVPIPTTSAA